MTILLTNRVMIAIGISNLGLELFWNRVYASLNINIAPETISFLQSQDHSWSYRKKYKERHDVKLLRMIDANNKIK